MASKAKTAEPKTEERVRLNPKDVRVGHVMAFVNWARVDTVGTFNGNPSLHLTNVDNGESFRVNGTSLVEEAYSADAYSREEKVTKTQAAELLISSYGKPFTVVFEKTDGETRKLRGRLVKPEPLLGRSMVEDLDLGYDVYRLRQVDHRTISSLILDGVKYTVKGG